MVDPVRLLGARPQVQHAGAVGTAIDQVAEIDQAAFASGIPGQAGDRLQQRAKLGSFLKGKELREYQAEIDEAVERKAELESRYNERRGNLPSVLKKLTNGYEMRTYW